MEEKKKFGFRSILKYAGNILTILAFVFIVRSLMAFDIDYSKYLGAKSLLLILLFTLISTGIVFLGAVHWRILLEFISKKTLPLREIVNVYVKSNLGKYIPGNVMQFVNRNLLGSELGISQTGIALSTVLEIAMLCTAAGAWSLILGRELFLELIGRYLKDISMGTVLIIIIAIVLIAIIALIIIRKKWQKFFEEIRGLLSLSAIPTFLKSFLLLSFNFLVNGVILTMIVGFTTSVDIQVFFTITTGYIISWIIGFVVPGAPGGIGVREAVLTFIVGPVIGVDVILAAAVVQRFILVVADVISYLLVVIGNKKEPI